MITPELAAAFQAKHSEDPIKMAILHHAKKWNASLYQPFAGYSEEQCRVYRLAMEWVVETLLLDELPEDYHLGAPA